MDNQKKLLSLFSLSKRAGKLLLGFDTVKEAVGLGKAHAVFLAEDLSEKTKREVLWFCEKAGAQAIPVPFPMEMVQAEVGKRSGILAVTEDGLEKKIVGETKISGQNE